MILRFYLPGTHFVVEPKDGEDGMAPNKIFSPDAN